MCVILPDPAGAELCCTWQLRTRNQQHYDLTSHRLLLHCSFGCFTTTYTVFYSFFVVEIFTQDPAVSA